MAKNKNKTNYYSHYVNCSWSRIRIDADYKKLDWTAVPTFWLFECEKVKTVNRRLIW